MVFLGKKDTLLPSCAYSAIRRTFVNQEFSGFKIEDM